MFWLLLIAVSWLALVPKPPEALGTGWDKGNHVLAFLALALLAQAAWPRSGAWRVWLGLLAYGVLLELVQGLTPTRSADARDVLADALGIGLGHGLYWLAASARQRWQQLR